MNTDSDYISKLFNVKKQSFEEEALSLFTYQWKENNIYHQYCNHLSKNPTNVNKLEDIPFLPISFFKTQKIICGKWTAEKIFLSSGTTQSERSRHHIQDLNIYHLISKKIFEDAYGDLKDYLILALLPSYLEQGDSSLIAMVDEFMKSASPSSKFVKGKKELEYEIKNTSKNILLIGVSFALLDLAESGALSLDDVIIIETGGMKGRRKEIVRQELHKKLCSAFNLSSVHSEYGMTELMSQAYATQNGVFKFPEWTKVLIRDINDPFTYLNNGKIGGINIIDLGNKHSCAFIETMDLGKKVDEDYFEVLGRIDNSDIRGCNLMTQ